MIILLVVNKRGTVTVLQWPSSGVEKYYIVVPLTGNKGGIECPACPLVVVDKRGSRQAGRQADRSSLSPSAKLSCPNN